MGSLDGRVALVTGGGSGIGLATARRLAAEGGAVWIVDRDSDAGGQAAAELDAGFGAAVVATASLAGLIPFPPDPIYDLTKHAVIGLVRSVAPAVAVHAITVNAVCPGIVDTPLVGDDAKAMLRQVQFPLIAPEEIAE